MKVSPFEEIKILEPVRPGVYKTKKLADSTSLKPKDILKQSDNIVLAVRACDGMFHRVNSDIADTLARGAGILRKSHTNGILAEAMATDSIHGSRFVIFHPKNAGSAFLLGDVQTTLKKLTKASV